MSAPKGPSLFQCIIGLKDIFQAHAGADKKLNKTELKEMLKGELSQTGDDAMVSQMMQTLDVDRDGLLDFSEFLLFVVGMACAFNGQTFQR
ncbi:unnamed protein product [Knipowitschia caucasica]|uniref:EF-hand domain-containing protein n=1 Tax=Knipowitschia caucasica TaxID=637954 RepID=A0AAV2KKT6_KNICA